MTIHYGALAEPLYKQCGVPEEKVAHIQKAVHGLLGLRIMDMVTDGEYGKILKRVTKRLGEICTKETEKSN
jgi:hypothetical protein